MSFFYEDGVDNPTSKTPNLEEQCLSRNSLGTCLAPYQQLGCHLS